MELGTRIREARLAQGLSQRALCGDVITRNMLSQIENGTARPSMDTLRYLAARLGKPVSYFLEEETVTSPNQRAMAQARQAARDGQWRKVRTALENYRGKDPVFDEEAALLRYLAWIHLAEQAAAEGKKPYAEELLARAATIRSVYITPALERERQTLLARVAGHLEDLPDIDEALLLHARAALETGEPVRAAGLLDGCRIRGGPEWNLLRGRAYLGSGNYAEGAKCLRAAEERYPAEAVPLLETAYRELGDYRMAYEYACRQRETAVNQ